MLAVKQKAIEYYPNLWSEERLKKLVVAGTLTKAEYKEVTGNTYSEAE